MLLNGVSILNQLAKHDLDHAKEKTSLIWMGTSSEWWQPGRLVRASDSTRKTVVRLRTATQHQGCGSGSTLHAVVPRSNGQCERRSGGLDADGPLAFLRFSRLRQLDGQNTFIEACLNLSRINPLRHLERTHKGAIAPL